MTKTLLAFALLTGLAAAQTPDLVALMRTSEAAWNRGDLESFVLDYDDSPETTFIGRTLTRGNRKAVLDRYRKGYPTRAAMGTLTYSEMQVREVSDGVMIMIGRFSLKRAADAGGDSAGRFTLVWKRTAAGWKIIHDHSS
jgi:ketosteroid isomerase-like protein